MFTLILLASTSDILGGGCIVRWTSFYNSIVMINNKTAENVILYYLNLHFRTRNIPFDPRPPLLGYQYRHIFQSGESYQGILWFWSLPHQQKPFFLDVFKVGGVPYKDGLY